MAERWKVIPGEYEGRYMVSNEGRVLSLLTDKILKPGKHQHGYPNFGLYAGKKMRRHPVHALMARAFLPEPTPEQCWVRHLDDDPTNNILSNLAWGTMSENAQDRVRNGHHHNAVKTHCLRDHEFTPENTIIQHGGARRCRTCRNDRRRELAAAGRAVR